MRTDIDRKSSGKDVRPGFRNYEQAQALAKRRLPAVIYRYLSDERFGPGSTYINNIRAFGDVSFLPRAAVVVKQRDLHTTVLGQEISFPVLIAPMGSFLRLIRPAGVVANARAAQSVGTICVVGSMSGHPPDAVTARAPGPLWYQLYWRFESRAMAANVIDQIQELGYRALVLTVDVPFRPDMTTVQRLQDLNMRTAIPLAPQFVVRPRWFLGAVRDGLNRQLDAARLLATAPSPQMAPTWDDVEWARKRWRGPMIVKGILTVQDAQRAVSLGADSVVVSNHGGIGLEGAPAALRALPRIVDAVGGKIEVMLDSGIRHGTDVAKAIALGARAVLIGHAIAWGLAAGGEDGVRNMLKIFHNELDHTLSMIGASSVRSLDRSYVEAPPSW